MRRVVEFDLVTKSEANIHQASRVGMIMRAKATKAQREAVGAVLRSHLTPPPLHVVQVADRFEHVGAVGLVVRNLIAVTITRIALGELDDDNIGPAVKHVRDEVAAWCGVPNDRDPVYKFTVPPPQEKAAPGVYRVRIEIVDKLTGADRVVRLAETRSAGVEAERRVKRAITKASKKPTVRDLHAAAERLLSHHIRSPEEQDRDTLANMGAAMQRQGREMSLRDPGEERSARDLTPCPTCRAPIHDGCRLDVPGRFVFGVHVARARAAGLHVPEDDRAQVKPARAPRGPRKLVPAARPAGQAVLPMLRAFAVLPWEQPRCERCDGNGEEYPSLMPERCPACHGTGRAKGRVLTRAARYDGLDDPPTTITASVPAEHVHRYGSTVTLTRQKFDSKATGPCWLYATKDERTTTS